MFKKPLSYKGVRNIQLLCDYFLISDGMELEKYF